MFLGICLWKLGDMENSYNAYSRAGDLDPEDQIIYLNFAIFLADNEKFEQAQDYYQRFERASQGKYYNGIPEDIMDQSSILKSMLGFD